MELAFRWYGKDDPIPIEFIKQIPRITGIVSALYDIYVGDVWPVERLKELKKGIEYFSLNLSAIESIPVHEDIKIGLPSRDKLIENYCQNIRNLGSLNIKVLCYNFMPVFDWTRSDLSKKNPDGSNSLSYEHERLRNIDLSKDSLELPGWSTSYTKDTLKNLLESYSEVNEETLWKNLEYFLNRVIPVAEKCNVKMAIHPDDPPWSIFNLPRIITNEVALERLVSLVDSPSNGITFCTGSFGPNSKMDLIKSIYKFGSMGRIHFVHFRNIKRTNTHSFQEVAHPTEYGDVNMYEIVKSLIETNFNGVIRPDHGRMIWGETGKPGYGLYDRALGAIYLSGLWEGIEKTLKS